MTRETMTDGLFLALYLVTVAIAAIAVLLVWAATLWLVSLALGQVFLVQLSAAIAGAITLTFGSFYVASRVMQGFETLADLIDARGGSC
jgi:hypothetical protein